LLAWRIILSSWVVLFGGTGDGPGELQVRREGPTVFVQGSRVALSDVLDRLASVTGMTVVYDGPRPRQLVTVHIEGRSEAETVRALLEGQAINYALTLDPSGLRVASLMLITDGAKGGAAGSRPAAPPANLGAEPSPDEFLADTDEETAPAPVPEPSEGGREMPPAFAPQRVPAPIEPGTVPPSPMPPRMPSFPSTPSNPGSTL
jgi:hypothetical protein